MARSKSAKHKQAKKTAAKAKAAAKAERADPLTPDSAQKLVSQPMDGPIGPAADNGASMAAVNDNADAATPIAAVPSNICVMSELLRLSESLVKKIIHTLVEDYGLTELGIDSEQYFSKTGGTADGTAKANPAPETHSSVGVDGDIQDGDSKESQRSYDEILQENDRLRSLLDERDIETEKLSRMVVLQQHELQVARSRVAQLDAFMVHEIGQISRRLPVTADANRLVQGLQHQYALRESHFASIETALALEIQMWQEKYICSESRHTAVAGDEKRMKVSSEEYVRREDFVALQDELTGLKETGSAVKQQLEDCDMLLQTLVDCNRDQREADCLQINELINNVEDLSNVKIAMMDYARTAMIRSQKLEDLCRALQAQRKGTSAQNHQGQRKQQQSQHQTCNIKRFNNQMFSAMESVFASAVATGDLACLSDLPDLSGLPGLPGLSSDHFSLDGAMGDLQPLMSQLATAFSTGKIPQQRVMVGDSPRVIRTPRRRNSGLRKPNSKSGKQNQPLSASGSSKDVLVAPNADADAAGSSTTKQSTGFVGVPSAEFTFSSL